MSNLTAVFIFVPVPVVTNNYLLVSWFETLQVSGRKGKFSPQVSLSNLLFPLMFLAFCTS